jgi:hypothetical protein
VTIPDFEEISDESLFNTHLCTIRCDILKFDTTQCLIPHRTFVGAGDGGALGCRFLFGGVGKECRPTSLGEKP